MATGATLFFCLRASLCVNMSGHSLAPQLIVLDSALIAHTWGKLPDSLINSVVPSLFAFVVNNSCQVLYSCLSKMFSPFVLSDAHENRIC